MLIKQGPMHEWGGAQFWKSEGRRNGEQTCRSNSSSSSGSALEGSAQKIVFQESTLGDRWL